MAVKLYKMNNKVLIITGGFITHKENSGINLLKKNFLQSKYAKHSWLETKNKINFSEPILLSRLEGKRKEYKKNKAVQSIVFSRENFNTPELTEVMLATLLNLENIPFECLNFDDLFNGTHQAEKKLKECSTVFVSTTFLRDVSELWPLLKMIKQAHHTIIVGGALSSLSYSIMAQFEYIDLIAVGTGEYLIQPILKWIEGNKKEFAKPEFGRWEFKYKVPILFSGTSKNLSLDDLPNPDWKLIENYHHEKYNMINYESVRGCPYRCSFCNYPYLFDDTKFRTKSAQKIAKDWAFYEHELGAKYITCLDSLFTMPRKRLHQLCEILINNKSKIKWICYARADDLADLETVKMMKAAGCHQVQIGAESGDAQILLNMNKRVEPEKNIMALKNCREVGLTTLASYVIGFPGETEQSLLKTYENIKLAPPDFFFLCLFSTRVPGVPILRPENKKKYQLDVATSSLTVSPYWRHKTMDCTQAARWTRKLNSMIIENKVSLDSTIFYQGILSFQPKYREDLLNFQYNAYNRRPWLRKIFHKLHLWSEKKLDKHVNEYFDQKMLNNKTSELVINS
jgi:radical SAM superfamily enzyme YgiQ (UPF0313 family)